MCPRIALDGYKILLRPAFRSILSPFLPFLNIIFHLTLPHSANKMLTNALAVLAAYAVTGSIAASTTVVSFYSDVNQCNIRVGGFKTIDGNSGCIALDTPEGTASVGAGHAGPASCITYYDSADCSNPAGSSLPIYLGSSSNSNNNLECSTGNADGSGFVPRAAIITDDTSACAPNKITIEAFAGAGCLASVGFCEIAGTPDGKSASCQHFSNAASYKFTQTSSRTDYVAYAFVDQECAGDAGDGPNEQGHCGALSNLGCVRVTDRDSGTSLEQIGESYDTAETIPESG